MSSMPKFSTKKRQRGAVAIIVGLSLFILVGMLAIMLDLSNLYVGKTGLQNGADAAALAGAKELNGTAAGVNAAVAKAIEVAKKNQYGIMQKAVGTNGADGGLDLFVGSSPDDGSMVAASSVTTDAAASNKTFLKVYTRNRVFDTWFAGIWGQFQTETFGLAVAGKYLIEVAPLAICALTDDPANPNDNELGYERGITYKMSDASLRRRGTMYWVDPVAQTAGACSGSTPASLPYMCTGKMTFTPVVGQNVYTNTGISDPQLEALDSRFDVFNSKNKCDFGTSPPDANIKEYNYSDSAAGSPKSWMNPDPTQQSITFATVNMNGTVVNMPVPTHAYRDGKGTLQPARSFGDYGVLWSSSRPQGSTVSQWPTLYDHGTATSYPETSPYSQGSGSPFFAAPSHTGKANRRVINLTIIDCKTAGGNCRAAKVLGIGKFFLTKKTNTPSDKNIYIEFGGLLSNPIPPADIRLYR